MATIKTVWTILLMCMAFGLGTAASNAQSADVPYALRVLENEVQACEADARAMSAGLPDQKKKSIGDLLVKQKTELAALIAKYRGRASVAATEISRDVQPFSKIAPAIWQQFAGGGIVKTGNSDGPHECSNHCYESCGYNSLGDLICYYRCTRCCNSGGC